MAPKKPAAAATGSSFFMRSDRLMGLAFMGLSAAIIYAALSRTQPTMATAAAGKIGQIETPAARVSTSPLAELELEQWRMKLGQQAAGFAAEQYPSGKYVGRGIVTSAGGRSYFTSLYVSLRILREVVNCTLPIEVFYVGDDELNSVIVTYMEKILPNTRFIDATKFPEAAGVNLKGYQIKAFALLHSSFEEALWLDSDNMPLHDPEVLFESSAFRDNGAVFWPDYCNMVSFRPETYDVFGLERPAKYNTPDPGKNSGWFDECDAALLREFETGEVLVDKRRAWAGLRMAAAVNANSGFFYKRLFRGDKMTFFFAFVAAKSPFYLVPFAAQGAGVAQRISGRGTVFCGNTMIQHHPDTGAPFFLHRTLAKYKDAYSYLHTSATPQRAWTHTAVQAPHDSWFLTFRDELPSSFFMGDKHGTQMECVVAKGKQARITAAGDAITGVETHALRFLADIETLPFYPAKRKCTEASAFLCQHA